MPFSAPGSVHISSTALSLEFSRGLGPLSPALQTDLPPTSPNGIAQAQQGPCLMRTGQVQGSAHWLRAEKTRAGTGPVLASYLMRMSHQAMPAPPWGLASGGGHRLLSEDHPLLARLSSRLLRGLAPQQLS